jgi:XTP/dITP diphosphohydrolase
VKLLIASKNQGKIKEIKNILKGLDLQIVTLSDFPRSSTFKETADSFAQNAIDKAIFYNKLYNLLTVADDSGLMVDYLDGAPGVLSARFAGPHSDDKARIDKLLKLLEEVDFNKRKAHFHCVLAVAEAGKIISLIEESVYGYILKNPSGKAGFGYDPVFYYPPLQKSFAQLSLAEKNKVSHRGKALIQLRRFIEHKIQQKL